MDRRITRLGLGLGVAAFLGLMPAGARAQFPSIGSGGGGVASNGYATPTGAPFLNSMAAVAMSQQNVDPGTAALYFMSTSQPGSMMSMGRINQNRPTAGLLPGTTHSAKDAQKGGANVPGALASRYFNRTTSTGPVTDRYYKRQPRQYPNYSQTR
jgi:hypothetical protein